MKVRKIRLCIKCGKKVAIKKNPNSLICSDCLIKRNAELNMSNQQLGEHLTKVFNRLIK